MFNLIVSCFIFEFLVLRNSLLIVLIGNLVVLLMLLRLDGVSNCVYDFLNLFLLFVLVMSLILLLYLGFVFGFMGCWLRFKFLIVGNLIFLFYLFGIV